MEKKQFIEEIAKKLYENKCDLFVGSGISAPSNLPTWKDFLQPYLSDLKIELNDCDDLPLMAQYMVNQNSGNRNIISEAIFDVFGRDYPLNPCHTAIADFPVKTVWTTNYDLLLEKAFAHREVRVIASEDALIHPHNSTDVEIIKLHGSAGGAAREIVLTRADYDCFLFNKPKLAQRLRETFINRSILFIGYSCHDPNIQSVMTQAYQMMGELTQKHYILIDCPERKDGESIEEFGERLRRFRYWLAELKRIGICSLDVSRNQIAEILKKIAQKSHGNTVFVTGTHEVHDNLKKYAQKVGKYLAQQPSVIFNSGQSDGIGNTALSAFMEYAIRQKQDINQRIRIYPNPYAISPNFSNDRTLIPALKQARTPLMINTSLVVLFPGGLGTKAEAELACEKNRPVFPVVQKKKDFSSEAIAYILQNKSNNVFLKKHVPPYYQQLRAGKIPSEQMTLRAIREIIHEKN